MPFEDKRVGVEGAERGWRGAGRRNHEWRGQQDCPWEAGDIPLDEGVAGRYRSGTGNLTAEADSQ